MKKIFEICKTEVIFFEQESVIVTSFSINENATEEDFNDWNAKYGA